MYSSIIIMSGVSMGAWRSSDYAIVVPNPFMPVRSEVECATKNGLSNSIGPAFSAQDYHIPIGQTRATFTIPLYRPATNRYRAIRFGGISGEHHEGLQAIEGGGDELGVLPYRTNRGFQPIDDFFIH
jgi:hypothetical protein